MSGQHLHKAVLLSLTLLAFICGTATSAHAQLRAASLDHVGDSITCSIANASYQLTPDKTRIRFEGLSSETQEAFNKVTRYTDLRSKIYTIPVMEHINVEICPGEVNYIAYNADWLLNLYNDTSSRWALYTIIAHEVGHYILAHDRRSSGSNPKIELEADEYAGEVLAKMGASLKEAQSAYRSRGMRPALMDGTHPPTDQRLEAVKKGWLKLGGTALSNTGSPVTEGNVEECATCVRPGPVELRDSVYGGGTDNKYQFKVKTSVVHYNTDSYLEATAKEITDRSGSHVWDKKEYDWTKKNGEDNLLLAWKNLSTGEYGWVVTRIDNGVWYYKSNRDHGKWTSLNPEGDLTSIWWQSSGQMIEIALYVSNRSKMSNAESIQYRFGYSNQTVPRITTP